MKILIWIAYAAWALAAFVMFVGLDTADVLLMGVATSMAVSGVLFFAFERVISLLADIRDAVAPKIECELEQALTQPKPTRSIAEISADLERMKANQDRDSDAAEAAWQRLEGPNRP